MARNASTQTRFSHYETNPRSPRLASPNIPGELVSVESLERWIEDDNDGDLVVDHVEIASNTIISGHFALLELSESRVQDCTFTEGDFSRALFTDVEFVACDFSNSDFSEANFTNCVFLSCKFTGADFREAVFQFVEVRDTTCSYAAFTKAKLDDFSVSSSDFSGADIAEALLRRVAFNDVRFLGASFFRTSLAGVDLTSCQLNDMVFSDDMSELRGCTMDIYQAAGIAQRLGVILAD